uniref:Chromosome 16 open reading frame 78 n=1 Tax=Propithecus coquereli TaxID=379532 RepID=A0A2K6G0X9_PROCO
MSEQPEDLKDLMPTERKSMWRTAEERRMSDLTRVLEWLERRKGKKKQTFQQQKSKGTMVPSSGEKKEEKKVRGILKTQGKNQAETPGQASGQSSSKEGDPAIFRRVYGLEQKAKHYSMVPGNYTKDGSRKSDLDIKDVIALESMQRPSSFRRQSVTIDPSLQDSIYGTRKGTFLRDWTSKTSDSVYERKLKSLMEKGTEPKIESARMLKPEEVLSCRYLRLSKNNIRTLLKLCRDAGMNVDIHPHMVEAEIDAKKVFSRIHSVAL